MRFALASGFFFCTTLLAAACNTATLDDGGDEEVPDGGVSLDSGARAADATTGITGVTGTGGGKDSGTPAGGGDDTGDDTGDDDDATLDATVPTHDAGTLDSGGPGHDSGAPDAGAPDAGPLDAGKPDSGPSGPTGTCSSTFGHGLTSTYGRIDGTLYAVVKPTDHQCAVVNSTQLGKRWSGNLFHARSRTWSIPAGSAEFLACAEGRGP